MITSTLLAQIPSVIHGFGTFNEPTPLAVAARLEAEGPKWKQTHSLSVADVTQQQQECGEVDALYTAEMEIPVGIKTADCVPILMAHRDGQGVVAIHAGWRGTRGRIVEKGWDVLRGRGDKATEWVAAIGPSIGPCCYEVSEELAQEFESEFGWFGNGIAVPRSRILDLQGINACLLENLGLAQVDVLRHCTRCSVDPAFHSYRKSQGKLQGQQFSVIMKAPGRKP